MRKKLALVTVLGFVLVAASSCSRLGTSPDDNNVPDILTYDDQLREVETQLSGFGGMFYDDEGNLNVYLKGSEDLSPQALNTQKAGVESALDDVFGETFLAQGSGLRSELNGQAINLSPDIKILPAKYSLSDLSKWQPGVNETLQLDTVVMTDLDEASNRLKIGIEPGTSPEAVKASLKKQGVSLDAVIITEVEPIEPLATVRDRFRPTKGGIQLTFPDGSNDFLCTLGFNAYRSGVRGFVTNSHCTRNQGGVDPTYYYQNTKTGSNYIGYEIADPNYFTSIWPWECPWGRRCRYSDSAFVRYTSSQYVASSLGRIARPTSWTGSLTVSTSNPEFRIISETATPASGSYLDKVGRTTGWTYGRVSATCTNVNVSGTNITLLCQNRVQRPSGSSVTISAGGDSGSPVFRWLSGNNVSLNGILWGGNSAGTEFVFSSMRYIEQELGSLTTF